jgi:tRNA pseudouridine38-40 synthase
VLSAGMRVRGVVGYLGGGFHGWARQPGLRTVQGVLEEALSRCVASPVALTVAGRTDAGVHARRQVFSCDLPDSTDLTKLQRSLNRMCGTDVAVFSLVPAGHDFSARTSATARLYRYRLLGGPVADPFLRREAWWVGDILDVAAMRAAAAALLGEHDFATFCKATSAGGTVRRLIRLDVIESENGAVVDVWAEATSFCHQMVRSIVGFLVTVGRGTRPASDAVRVLRAADRAANSVVAPPGGLVLWDVRYDSTSP